MSAESGPVLVGSGNGGRPHQTSASGMTTLYHEHEADVVVSRAELAAADVIVLTLTDPHGRDLPDWTPGAHIDLMLTPLLTRQYSLCGDPADRESWRIGVLRDPSSRGGSRHIHDVLGPGSRVRMRGPRNHFPLVDSDRYLFIAGGIGITPILPMIAAVDKAGADWQLLYGGRRRSSMAFLPELTRYGDRVALRPEDEFGLLDLASALGTPRADTLVYCCGPEPLLAAVEERCSTWPAGSLHIERFAPKAVPVTAVDRAFEVVFQRSGVTVFVPPDRSIIDVADEAGVPVLSSCQEGICGTCETFVLEGEPEHRDSLLTPAEQEANEVMMICVSRARSPRLVLDL